MDSNKIGPNINTALTNAPVQKNKGVTNDGNDLKKAKGRSDASDFNVNLSDKSKEMAEARLKAMDIAKNTSAIREDKVADLKQRIQSGEYKASAENIADGMLREAIKDELSKGEPEL